MNYSLFLVLREGAFGLGFARVFERGENVFDIFVRDLRSRLKSFAIAFALERLELRARAIRRVI